MAILILRAAPQLSKAEGMPYDAVDYGTVYVSEVFEPSLCDSKGSVFEIAFMANHRCRISDSSVSPTSLD